MKNLEQHMDDELDKLNALHDAHKSKFKAGGYHTTLWQIMVNESCTGAFEMLADGSLIVALKNGGYVPTPASFRDTVTQTRRQAVLNDLNMEVFNLTVAAARDLVKQSMAQQ